MARRFKYTRDRRTRRLTWIISAVVAVAFAAVVLLVAEEYLRAWIVVMMFIILLLFIMSIPRSIRVSGEAFEIHCVVEMTRIAIKDINSVRHVTRRDTGFLLPLLGSYGFFGYYGYFLSLRRWEMVYVYATQWEHLVEIEDVYESRYLVSCQQADLLIEMIMQAKLLHAGEDSVDHPPREE
ncbi:MAG: PH domain-containing protein [Rikenellaceae bacterium]|nr:PH domain-containing protein [Rikenellaceae bacterium]MCL2692858.1 PH domain-containing protein [Rikenellaceae bacterium]